jgi:hypothetical protein
MKKSIRVLAACLAVALASCTPSNLPPLSTEYSDTTSLTVAELSPVTTTEAVTTTKATTAVITTVVETAPESIDGRVELAEGFYALDMSEDEEMSEWWLFNKRGELVVDMGFDKVGEGEWGGDYVAYRNRYWYYFKINDETITFTWIDVRRVGEIWSCEDDGISQKIQKSVLVSDIVILTERALKLLVDLDRDYHNTVSKIDFEPNVVPNPSGKDFVERVFRNNRLQSAHGIRAHNFTMLEPASRVIQMETYFDDSEYHRMLAFSFVNKSGEWEINTIFDVTGGW